MASAGLKRSSPSDLPSHSANLSSSFWSANKRRCTAQMPQQQRPFRDSASIIGSLSDDVTAMIKNEVTKHQQNQHHHHLHHHHHHNQQQQQQHPNQNQLPHLNLQQQQQHLLHNPSHQQNSPSTSNHQYQNQNQSTNSASGSNHLDAPVLSIRQTQAICEKLIKEREQKLREEYDKILISKLAEQYDTFVKYTHDHIERRYNETNSHQASYLS